MSLIASSAVGENSRPVEFKWPSDRKSSSSSAVRALDVLEVFGHVKRPMRAIEFGRWLDLKPSSANQLLKSMVDSGHLVFAARGKSYLPSPRLAGFSIWFTGLYGDDAWLRNLVQQLHDNTGLVAVLATPNDQFMQIVDSACPEDMKVARGLRVSVFGTALGAAYLSTLDSCEVKRLAGRARIPATEMNVIESGIAKVRAEGWAAGSAVGGQYWSIAIPLQPEGLPVPLVLGLSGPAHAVRGGSEGLRGIMSSAITYWQKGSGHRAGDLAANDLLLGPAKLE